MRKPIVAGNWKMNGTQASVAELTEGVLAGAGSLSGVEVLLCPPFVFLSQVQAVFADSDVKLGAQDLHVQADGAYTGEISGSMLKDAQCEYVIVGHSERRALMGDDNEVVARKFAAALEHG